MAQVQLVFGAPGTGKSYYLVERAAEYIAFDRTAGDSMLAVSFSNAAAAVLRSRMGIDSDHSGTIHSFGRAYLEGAKIIDAPARKGFKNELLENWNADFPQWAISVKHIKAGDIDELEPDTVETSRGNRLLALSSLFRHMMLPVEQWNHEALLRGEGIEIHSSMKEYWTEWTRFKRRWGCIDFTDMIERPYLERAPVPFGAEIVFSDEHQDSTPLIHARLMQMAEIIEEYGQVFIAGDDDQCIYSHLGCSPENMLGVDGEKVILPQSYRMPRIIHEYSQRWIQRVKRREYKEFKPARDEGELVFSDISLTRRNPLVQKQLAELVRHESEELGRTVMVLASTNQYIGQAVATLREAGIPFANKNRPANGQWNPLGRTGLSGANASILAWGKTQYGEEWTHKDILRMAKFFKTSTLFKNAIRMIAEIEKMDAEELNEPIDEAFIVHNFKSIEAYADFASGSYEIVRQLLPVNGGVHRGSYNLTVHERLGAPGLTTEPRVTVGTIHSCKGDEADTVILFPDISNAAFKGKNDIDHLIRTFYVGLTRAKHKLVIGSRTDQNHAVLLPRV